MTSLGIPRESRDLCAIKSQLQAQLSLFYEAKVIFDIHDDSYMHSSPKKARQTWQKPDFGDVLNLHKWMATITAGLPVIAVSVIGPSRDWVGGYSGLGQGDYGINQLWARFEAVKITLFLRK